MRGRVKKNARAKPPPKIVVLDYAAMPKINVHYRNGVDDAKRDYKPTWFDEEATEWKCVERDAYRAGYRTIKRDA